MTVYFIRRKNDAGGPIKIGHTEQVAARLANLRVGSPDGYDLLLELQGGVELEAYLHSALRHSHYEGEWFSQTEEVNDLIEKLKAYGIAALPSGAVGNPIHRRIKSGSAKADVEEAKRLIRIVALRLPSTSKIVNVLWEIQRVTGLGPRRLETFWAGTARKIEAWEMALLREAAAEISVQAGSAAEERMAALERKVDALMSWAARYGSIDDDGTSSERRVA